MKTKFMRIGKRSLSIALSLMMVLSTMIVGTVPVNALDVQIGAYVYFDNTNTNWSGNIQFAAGNSSDTNVYAMTKLTGTNLYYVKLNNKFDNATYSRFFTAGSVWTSGNWTDNNITTNATNYTDKNSWTLNNGSTYLFTPADKTKGTAITPVYYNEGYSALNKSITVSSEKSDDGVHFSSCDTSASLNSSAKLTGNGTVETSTSKAALTATVTLNPGTAPNGYKFAGWVDENGTSVTSPFVMSSSSKTTYKARFVLDKKPCATVSLTPASTSATVGDTVTLTGTITATDGITGNSYVLKDGDTTVKSGTETSFTYDVNTTAAATHNFTLTVTPNSANAENYKEATATATVTVSNPHTVKVNGRFPVNSSGTLTGTGSGADSWKDYNATDSNISFTHTGNGIYTLDTGLTLETLTTFVNSTNVNTARYFMIRDIEGGKTYYSSTGVPSDKGEVNKVTLTEASSNSNTMKFSSSLSSVEGYNTTGSHVILYFNINTKEFWYDIDGLTTYTITAGSVFYKDEITPSGTISQITPDSQQKGRTVTFYAKPSDAATKSISSAYYIAEGSTEKVTVTATGVNNTNGKQFSFTMPESNVIVYAVESDAYAITPMSDTGISVVSCPPTAAAGERVNVTVELDSSYKNRGNNKKIGGITVSRIGEEIDNEAVTSETGKDFGSTIENKYNKMTYSFVMPESDVSVTPYLAVLESYKIILDYDEAQCSASVSGGGQNSSDATPYIVVTEGTSVTFSTSAKTGYQFTNWEVSTNIESDGTSNAYTGTINVNSKSSQTITPKENITLKAVYEESLGTLTSAYRLLFGDQKDNILNLKGKAVGSTGSENYDKNIQVYQDGTKIIARFTKDTVGAQKDHNSYLIFSDVSSGNYGSFKCTTDTNNSKVYTNTIDAIGATLVGTTTSYGSSHYEEQDGSYLVFVNFKDIENTDTITVTCDTSTGLYTIDATLAASANAPKLYAKDGTVGFDSCTNKYGDTTATITKATGNTLDPKEKDYGQYKRYYVEKGDTVKVQTVVDSAYGEGDGHRGEYVAGYIVNTLINGNLTSVSYGAKKTATNTYELDGTLTIEEGVTDIEITPVYFNKKAETNNNYITFYFDAETIGDHWNNTISVYAYYHGSAIGETGGYPGQPMLQDSTGKYYTKILKYNMTDDGTIDTTQAVRGLTINNLYERETVHQMFMKKDKSNLQTYDYDDFVRIANLGVDTIEFDAKYKHTGSTHQSHVVGNGNAAKPSYISPAHQNLSSYSSEDITSHSNYEVLTNLDGEICSVLNFTEKDATAAGETFDKDNLLHIVSVGNQDTAMGTWSTVWYVYGPDGKFVTSGLPSDFIPRGTINSTTGAYTIDPDAQTAAYKAIVAKDYEYNLAYVTYEKEQNAGSSSDKRNTGTRLDGRWLYSTTPHADIEVKILKGIEGALKTDLNDSTKWSVDSDETTITGKITNAKAYATDKGATTPQRKLQNRTRGTDINVTAENGSGYAFAGWATEEKDASGNVTYKLLSDFSKSTGTISLSSNTTLYALMLPAAGLFIQSAIYNPANDDTTVVYNSTKWTVESVNADNKLQGAITNAIVSGTIEEGTDSEATAREFTDNFAKGDSAKLSATAKTPDTGLTNGIRYEFIGWYKLNTSENTYDPLPSDDDAYKNTTYTLTTSSSDTTTTVYALYVPKTDVKVNVELKDSDSDYQKVTDTNDADSKLTVKIGSNTATHEATQENVVVGTESITLTTTQTGNAYKFDGWFIKTENGDKYEYTPLVLTSGAETGSNLTTGSKKITTDDLISTGVEIVARYSPADKVNVTVKIACLDEVGGTFADDTDGTKTGATATVSGEKTISVNSGSNSIASSEFVASASTNESYAFLGWYDGTDLSTLVASSSDIKEKAPTCTNLIEDKTVYALYVKVPTFEFTHTKKQSGDPAATLGIKDLVITTAGASSETVKIDDPSSCGANNSTWASVVKGIYQGKSYTANVKLDATVNDKTKTNYIGSTYLNNSASPVITRYGTVKTVDWTEVGETSEQNITLDADKINSAISDGNVAKYTYKTDIIEKVTLKVIAQTDENNGNGYVNGQVSKHDVTSTQTVTVGSTDTDCTETTTEIEIVKGAEFTIAQTLTGNNVKNYYTFEGFFNSTYAPFTLNSISSDTIVYARYKANQVNVNVQVAYKNGTSAAWATTAVPAGLTATVDSANTITVNKGSDIESSEFTHSNGGTDYAFVGWYDGDDLASLTVAAASTTTPEYTDLIADKTVYALFVKVPAFTFEHVPYDDKDPDATLLINNLKVYNSNDSATSYGYSTTTDGSSISTTNYDAWKEIVTNIYKGSSYKLEVQLKASVSDTTTKNYIGDTYLNDETSALIGRDGTKKTVGWTEVGETSEQKITLDAAKINSAIGAGNVATYTYKTDIIEKVELTVIARTDNGSGYDNGQVNAHEVTSSQTVKVTGVTPDTNCTDAITPIKVVKGTSPVITSVLADNDYYTFEGFNTNANGGSATSLGTDPYTVTNISGDTTIYALYKIKPVTVDVQVAYKNGTSADWTTTSIPNTLTAKVDSADSKTINAGDSILGKKFVADSSNDDYVFLGWYYANNTLDTKLSASSPDIKDSVEDSAFSNLTANKTAYALFVKVPTLTFKHVAETGKEAKAKSLEIGNLKIYKDGSDDPTLFLNSTSSTTSVTADGVSIELPKDTTGFKDVVKGIYKGTDYTFTVDVKASANSGSYVGNTTYGTSDVVTRGKNISVDTDWETTSSIDLDKSGTDNTYTLKTSFNAAGEVKLTVVAKTNDGSGYADGQVANHDATSSQTITNDNGDTTNSDGYTTEYSTTVDKAETPKITSTLTDPDNYYTFVGFFDNAGGEGTRLDNTTNGEYTVSSPMTGSDVKVYALYKINSVDVNVKVAYKNNKSDANWTVGNLTNINAYIDTNKTTAKVNAGSEVAGSRFSKNSSNDNYTFVGWYYADSSASTSLTISDGDIKSEMENFTIGATSKDVYALYIKQVDVNVKVAYKDSTSATNWKVGTPSGVSAYIGTAGTTEKTVNAGDSVNGFTAVEDSDNNYVFLGWYEGDTVAGISASSSAIKTTAPTYTNITENKTVYALFVKVPTLTFKHVAETGKEAKAKSLEIGNLKIYKGTSDTPTLSLNSTSSTTSVTADGVSIELPKNTTGFKEIVKGIYKGTDYTFTVDVKAIANNGSYVGNTTYGTSNVVERLAKSTGDSELQTINQKLTLSADDKEYTFITPFTEAGKVTLTVIARTDINDGNGYKTAQVNDTLDGNTVTSSQTLNGSTISTSATTELELIEGSSPTVESTLTGNDGNIYQFVGFNSKDDGTGTDYGTGTYTVPTMTGNVTIYALYKLNKPTSGTVQVFFKYYQRKTPDGTPADIDSKPTTYESSINITADTTYTKFFGDATNIVNKEIVSLTDTYTLYTEKINNTHKNQYNKDGTDGEKWVTFKTNSSNDYFEDKTLNKTAKPLDDGITSVTIWLQNTPREYSVTMIYPNSLNDLQQLDANKAVGMGKSKTYKAYYNVRLGVKINDTSNADAATNYLNGYGISNGYLNQNLLLPEEELGDYTFSYWSSDIDGKNIVSTDLHYNYRITKDITLYAIYSKAEKPKGVSISSVATDRFVTDTGVNKTRINDVVAVYGFTDDTATKTYSGIQNIGTVYVKVSATNNNDTVAKEVHDYIVDHPEIFKQDYQTLTIDHTNGGFNYYYDVKGSSSVGTPYTGYKIELTNKNRVMLSFDANTTKFNEGAAYSNMLVFAVAVVDDQYYVSDNYVSYKNGEPTDKTI